MTAFAIMSRKKVEYVQKVGYGQKAPFDGVTTYISIDLHDGTRNHPKPVTRRIQGQIDKNETVEVMLKKEFAPRKPVDEIAIELADRYGGRFYGAMCSADYVAGYVAFRIEEQAKADELFNSL